MGVFGNLFGGKDRSRARDSMRDMQGMANNQNTYWQGQQKTAQGNLNAQKQQFKDFEFTNDFEGLTNPYANVQTEFDNVYGEAQNTFAGAQNTFAGMGNAYSGMDNSFAGMNNAYTGLENQFAGMDNAYAGMQNKYEGMENRFEDMTVDMRAANFQTQQGQQQRSNIMQGLKGAAGSSGVAGLAQAMANQGQLQSQQIAAGIGQQERQNQMMSAQEGSRIDQLQRGAGMQLQSQQAGGAMAIQQAERTGAAQLQSQAAGADMSNQQMAAQGQMGINMATAQGQMQNQQMSAQGAMQAQQMQMQGAAQQQQMILGGEAAAQAMGVQQQNLQAQGQGQIDIMQAEGAAAVQAAQFGQQSTLLGMEYGALAGANAGLSQAQGNQLSALGMAAKTHGANASSITGAWGDVAQGIGNLFGSDRRLKKNINLIGNSPSGLNIYSFEYKNAKYGEGLFQGVMSDEIPQEAVMQMNNGYDAVNYSMLDVEFKQI